VFLARRSRRSCCCCCYYRRGRRRAAAVTVVSDRKGFRRFPMRPVGRRRRHSSSMFRIIVLNATAAVAPCFARSVRC